MQAALTLSEAHGDPTVVEGLRRLAEEATDLAPQAGSVIGKAEPVAGGDGDWVVVIQPGELGVMSNADGTKEVRVLESRYTPQGLMYRLSHPDDSVTWMAPADTVVPFHGETKLLRTNLMTGETMPLAS